MGKASNRKKEKLKERQVAVERAKQTAPSPMTPTPQLFVARVNFPEYENLAKPVYRFFKDPKHADDFLNGKIWISTLEACRGYENPVQGDPGEATMTYSVSRTITGGGSDPYFVEIARRMGLIIKPEMTNITLSNVSTYAVNEDALLICTTTEYNPDALGDDFGSHCVEISQPIKFFKLLTRELAQRYLIDSFAIENVHYRDRHFEYLDTLPVGTAFVKPPRYSYQKEVRMLWAVPKGTAITPGTIHIPGAAKYCRRVSPE